MVLEEVRVKKKTEKEEKKQRNKNITRQILSERKEKHFFCRLKTLKLLLATMKNDIVQLFVQI